MAGFSNITGDESIMFANNVSFNGTERGGKVTTDGQLLIGATTSPHIRVNTLTAGTGVSITNGAGSITISSSPSSLLNTTEDSGTAAPVANNLNVLGQKAGTVPVMFTTGSGATINVEDRTWLTSFVVDGSSTVGLRGTYTTIQSAITAAAAVGGVKNVFIRSGTYTENIILSAGINLAAFDCDAFNPSVTIQGTTTASYNGIVSISGVNFLTNAATAIATSGTNTSQLNLIDCSIQANDSTGITMNSSNFAINLYDCVTTGSGSNAILNITSGNMAINHSLIGGTTTASTIASGVINIYNSVVNTPITTSSAGSVNSFNSLFNLSNTTLITFAGTGQGVFANNVFETGTSSSISIGSGCSLIVSSSTLNSSNTNVITGAGTLTYGGLVFVGASSGINVTTQIPVPFSVPQGGSGVSSFSNTSSLLTSGTTTTGALQNIASVATGQVLVSQGASTLPGWSAAPTLTSVKFGAGSVLSTYVQAGSWTPGVSFGGGTTGITYTTQSGEYTQIGNIVFVSFNMTLSSKGSSTGNASLTGLPVSAAGTVVWTTIDFPILASLPASTSNVVVNPSGTTGALYGASTSAAGLTNLTNAHFGNTSQLNGAFCYFTS